MILGLGRTPHLWFDDFPPETNRYPSHIGGEYHYAHEDLLQKTKQQQMFPPTHTYI